MATILTNSHTCLFCGKPIEQRYEEDLPYYECNCSDAVKDRLITEEIQKLETTRPKRKFRIKQEQVLYPIIEKD
ncbi:MAG: hypothetical protein WCO66_00055 [Candidatus Absconditabacteria bacterium]